MNGSRHDPNDSDGLVTVLTTADRGVIAVARSLLESEGIRSHVKGEGLRDLTGLARLTTAFDPSFGAVDLQVHESDLDVARTLLHNLK